MFSYEDVVEKDEGDITSYMFSDVHKALKKIIKDQKLGSKLEEIHQVIDDTEPKPIALYQVNKVDKLQKGVMMLAYK